MHIKVGYADYQVRPLRSDAPVRGLCYYNDHIIELDAGLPPGEQAVTLVHEIIHACFAAFVVSGEGLDEEEVCKRLEVPLAMVLRDNPRLPGVLRKAMDEGRPIVKRRRGK
jgi:hypothetical protein